MYIHWHAHVHHNGTQRIAMDTFPFTPSFPFPPYTGNTTHNLYWYFMSTPASPGVRMRARAFNYQRLNLYTLHLHPFTSPPVLFLAMSDAAVEGPRRSTRISSQAKPAAAAAPAAAKKPRVSRKRSADDSGDAAAQESTAKKSKPASAKKGTKSKSEAAESDNKEAAAEEIDELAKESGEEDVKTIDIGDSLPSLTLKNEKNEDINVADLTAEKGVVFFLVPKADTPGCTTQACGFRDIYPDFTSTGFDVYCLSADTPTAQTKWQTKKELPYSLLSDPKRTLIKALGAGEGNKTKRSHFIFEKGGKLVEKKNPVKPADSPKLALDYIKSIAA